jgi:uncharacterized protein YceK
MKRLIHSVILLAVALSCTGCATAFVRSDSTVDPRTVYPATVFDAEVVWHGGIRGEPPMATMDNKKTPMPFRMLCVMGGIVDLPISFVLDTILLPYDIYCISRPDEP